MSAGADPGVGSPLLRRNAIVNVAGRGLSALLWIVLTPYVLGRLGPERFGVWSLFFVLSGYVGILDLGMAGGVSRFIATAAVHGDREEVARILRRTLFLSAAIGLGWTVLCVLGRGLFLEFFHIPIALRDEVSASLVIFAFSLLILSVAQVNQWALMGFQRFDLFNLYFLVGLLVNGAVLVVGLAAGGGLPAAAAAAVAGQTAVLLFAARSVWIQGRRLTGDASAERVSWRELLGFGAMVQASNALSAGQMQAARVMLGALGQLLWVTQFELGFRVTNGLWSLSTLIQYAAYPAAAHAQAVGGVASVREVYAWCCRWVFVTAAAVLGLVWLIAPPLLRLWLGDVHPQTILVARWLVFAFAFSTLAGPTTAVARGMGAANLEVLNFGIALVINVALGLWWIPRRGPEGAALAMAVSFGVATVALLAVFHRRLGVSTGAWLRSLALPRLLPAVLAAGGLWLAFSRWRIDSRGEAFVACAAQGGLFTALFVALAWPTGDPRAIWVKVRDGMRRAKGEAGAGK